MKSTFLKPIILTVILVIISNTANSQQNEWKTHQIKLSPLRSINLFSPGLELSYELNYGQFSTQLSVAYLTDIFNVVARGSNFEGSRLNLEEKYFLKTYSNLKRRSYLSAEIGYNQIDMTVYSEFIPSEYLNESWQIQEENVYWDYCDINRKSVIGNVKYGMQFFVNHFTLDLALGIGIAHQNVKHFNKRNSEDKLTRTEPEDILSPLFYNEGKYFIFNFPLSFKLGVAF
jgi:hypothetical protein